MARVEQGIPIPIRTHIRYPDQAEVFVAMGVLSLGTTFLASLGNHSRIHKEILAPIALGAETLTTISGLILVHDNQDSDRLKTLGKIGLGVTAVCYLTVALTDIHIINHVQSGKGLGREDLTDLGQNLLNDFKRHMRVGTQIIFDVVKKHRLSA